MLLNDTPRLILCPAVVIFWYGHAHKHAPSYCSIKREGTKYLCVNTIHIHRAYKSNTIVCNLFLLVHVGPTKNGIKIHSVM